MKKLFLLALTLVLICNVAYTSEVTDSATATLTLNLGSEKSIVNVGFKASKPSLDSITSDAGNDGTLSISLPSKEGLAADSAFNTAESYFYVYWYIHAIKGVNGSSLSLTFTKLKPVNPDTPEKAADWLGYELVYNDIEKSGAASPATGKSSIGVEEGEDPAIEEKTITLISSNKATGLNKGSMKFTIPSFNYSRVSAQSYAAALTLNITAP